MSYKKLFETKITTETADAWRASGKKAIGYVCCHIPEEVVYAAGMLPVRLRGTNCVDSSDAETWMSSLSCSYARSILENLINGTYHIDGLVQTSGCMMQARILDNWEHIAEKKGVNTKVKMIDAPRITTDFSIKWYKSEIQEMVEFLEEISGVKVTNEALKEAVEKENEVRKLIKELYQLRNEAKVSGSEALQIMLAACDMECDEYAAALKEFLAEAKNRKPIEARARLLMIGSALDNPDYLKVIEEKGGFIVMDEYCFGQRAFGEPIEIKHPDDVLQDIAEYYLTRITCPRALDNRPQLHKEIVEHAKEYNAQGVIYEKMQHCECWGGETYYLEPALKAVDVPMLVVEREEQMANAGQLAIRAEAFVEMIEK